MIPSIQETCPNPVPPPATLTFVDDPSEPFRFDLFLGLLSVGGLRPNDGMTQFVIDQPPLLKVVVQWHSIAE